MSSRAGASFSVLYTGQSGDTGGVQSHGRNSTALGPITCHRAHNIPQISSGLTVISSGETITVEGARWYDLRYRHPSLSLFSSLHWHFSTTETMERRRYRTLHWSILHPSHAQKHLGVNASIGDSVFTVFPNFDSGVCITDVYQ